MYATLHTAQVLDSHRAADLVRDTELIRGQAERRSALDAEPVGHARLLWRFAALARPAAPAPRLAH